MIINAINSVNVTPKLKKNSNKAINPNVNFNGQMFNKKALKGISAAALLGLVATLSCCKQPGGTQPPVIEQPSENPSGNDQTTSPEDTPQTGQPTGGTTEPTTPTTPTEPSIPSVPSTPLTPAIPTTPTQPTDPTTPTVPDEPVTNVTLTAKSEIFPASKHLFDFLGLKTKTEKPKLVEGGYTPYSGDVLRVEYDISPSTKQSYELLVEKSTPEKLVYKNSMSLISSPDYESSYESTFEKDENGDIIRHDSTAPGLYFKYTLKEDDVYPSIRILAINPENDRIEYNETVYYQNVDSNQFMRTYRDFPRFYTNACVTVAE